jgi:hypothetical protein
MWEGQRAWFINKRVLEDVREDVRAGFISGRVLEGQRAGSSAAEYGRVFARGNLVEVTGMESRAGLLAIE